MEGKSREEKQTGQVMGRRAVEEDAGRAGNEREDSGGRGRQGRQWKGRNEYVGRVFNVY